MTSHDFHCYYCSQEIKPKTATQLTVMQLATLANGKVIYICSPCADKLRDAVFLGLERTITSRYLFPAGSHN